MTRRTRRGDPGSFVSPRYASPWGASGGRPLVAPGRPRGCVGSRRAPGPRRSSPTRSGLRLQQPTQITRITTLMPRALRPLRRDIGTRLPDMSAGSGFQSLAAHQPLTGERGGMDRGTGQRLGTRTGKNRRASGANAGGPADNERIVSSPRGRMLIGVFRSWVRRSTHSNGFPS